MATKSFDLDGYLNALRRKDTDSLLSYLADDVVFTDVSTGDELRGKDVFRKLFGSVRGALPDVDIRPEKVVRGDHSVAMLAHVNARYNQDIPLPDGNQVRLAGKKLDLRGAVFFETNDDGQVRRMTRLVDVGIVREQLGLSSEDMQRLRREMKALSFPSRAQPGGEMPPSPAP